MTLVPKINVRNSVSECAQSLRKENAGKYQNYAIKRLQCFYCRLQNQVINCFYQLLSLFRSILMLKRLNLLSKITV